MPDHTDQAKSPRTTPCAFFPRFGQLPARAFLLLTAQELAIHTWDIRSRFDAGVARSADLLPLLLARIPTRFGLPDLAAFPPQPEHVRARPLSVAGISQG